MVYSQPLTSSQSTASDSFIQITFLLLGIGILLPWNAYISAKQYFVSRLCNESGDGGIYHNIDRTIEMWFSIIYNGSSVLSLAVVILVQYLGDTCTAKANERIKSVRSMIFDSTRNLPLPMISSVTSSFRPIDTMRSQDHTIWYMVMVPLGVYLVVFGISTTMVFFTAMSPKLFLLQTLSGMFICGVCTAIASSGIVGTAGLFPSAIGINPFFNGQAMGGLLVACANFAASLLDGSMRFLLQYCSEKFSSDNTPQMSSNNFGHDSLFTGTDERASCIPYEEVSLATAGYFFMGTFVLAGCMLGYDYIDRYKQNVHRKSFAGDQRTDVSSMVEKAIPKSLESERFLESSASENYQSLFGQNGESDSLRINIVSSQLPISYQDSDENVREVRRQESTETDFTDTTENSQRVTVSVWFSVSGVALSLFFTYFCTLAIFPAWTSELSSVFQCKSSSRIRNDLFVPLSFVIFNTGDLAGRYISSSINFERITNLSRKLVWGSLARMFLFFFLFLFCKGRANRYVGWILGGSDAYSWTIQFSFAVTNGILTNIAFCYAPSLVENRTNPQQVASAILNFALTIGLLVGSFFSGPFLQFASGTGYTLH